MIIPVFNKAPFIKEAIESLDNGSFNDYEIVAVDDASTDSSLEVLHAIDEPRLRVIALPKNLGTPGAAMAAINAAIGEYLVRLDADDLAVPDRIAKQVAFMDANPDIGASSGYLQLFGERDKLWKFPLTNEECQAEILFRVPISQGASIMRRSLITEHDVKYDPQWPNVGEDWLFWLGMCRITRFANLDEPMTLYRRGEHNISHGRDKVHDHALLFKHIFKFFDIPLSDDELEMQLLTMKYFANTPSRRTMRSYRAWLDKLLSINAQRSLFPEPYFGKRVELAWDGLYHYLPKRDLGAAMEHLKISGSWPKDRLMYLAKTRINSILGRS